MDRHVPSEGSGDGAVGRERGEEETRVRVLLV